MITTKWPRLLVTGHPVTTEQADDILIRTNHWGLNHTNDPDWARTLADISAEHGLPREPDSRGPNSDGQAWIDHSEARDTWNKRMGVLDLHYLHNSRIVSAWIGGPHGWCDWDGTIGCANYNIGKWPSDEEVLEDLCAIAAAFPFLTMTVQLVEDEGAGGLAGEWRVAAGHVVHDPEPAEQLQARDELTEMGILLRMMPGGERGVSPARLRTALDRVATERSAA
jgi:hypothetical protein